MSKKLIYLVSFVLVLGLTAGVAKGGLTDGLVGYWPLDGDAKDASGNGNDGVIMGNVTPTADRFGNPDSAMNFPGNVNNYIDLGQPPMLLIKGAMTVAAWVRADTMTQDGRILAKQGSSSGRSWSIQLESAGGFARFDIGINPTDRIRADSEPLSFGPDEWFHIAGVFRPGEAVELYINAELVKSEPTTMTTQWIENGLPVNIGRRPSPGTPWQGDIDEARIYSRALAPAEIKQVMIGKEEGLAFDPRPADGTTDVPLDVVLSWQPGEYAAPTNGHKVYFGESFNDVNDATGGVAQSASSYAPPQRLDFSTTYYWRVDEVNAPPTSHIEFKGEVWQFTTEPIAYPIDGNNITATASSTSQEGMGPENTINGSGLDVNDLHSMEATDMWLSDSEPNGAWIEYELDKVHKLHEMWVWNSNQVMEPMIGLGFKDVTIEYSVNGTDYTTLGTTQEFARAPGAADYAHNTTVDLDGVAAKYVRLTANSNWGGFLDQYGLSEVRFFSIPVFAREPSPDSGTTDVDLDVTLGFRAGREAVTHDVYLSSDEQAVIDGTAPVSTVTETSYGPLSLDLGMTYYWKINEVNEAETTITWQGDIWNFSTPEFFIVDGFEDYNDYPPDEIWATWVDGYGVPTNGATVGYPNPDWNQDEHYVETAIVHGGSQSMPFFYDNTGGAAYSEGERTFAVPQDWTEAGVQTLVLYFHGSPGNTGQLYVKVNGSKVTYDGDAADIAKPRWKQWSIDLAPLGAGLQNVTTLAIGIDGNGAGGTLYFDDIRLYRLAPEIVVPSEEIWIEAEAADTITDPMKTYDDPLASGGKYIGTDDGIGNEQDAAPADGVATYNFTAQGGTYKIEFRVIVTGGNNSFWVRIPSATDLTPGEDPDQPGSGWVRLNDISDGAAWHWDEVHSSDHGDAVANWTLPAGANTLEITRREDGTLLDIIVISKLD